MLVLKSFLTLNVHALSQTIFYLNFILFIFEQEKF